MGRVVLVVGGQKAGKSTAAMTIARRLAPASAPHLVAPADPADDELAERIAWHRRDRDPDVVTVEALDVADALRNRIPPDAPVVIDALDTWLLHAAEQHGLFDGADDQVSAPLGEAGRAAQAGILADVDDLVAAAAARHGPTVVVAGVVGMGMHGPTVVARRYEDVHGLACQVVGRAAADTLLVVAGQAMPLSPIADLDL